jgi:hypothetical protein
VSPAPARPRMLSEVVSAKLRAGHYSLRTEETYWHWTRRFLEFCRDHPHLTPAGVESSFTRGFAHGPPSEGAEREKPWRHPRELGGPEVAAFLEHLAEAGQVSPHHFKSETFQILRFRDRGDDGMIR